jgi:hypothetical protein
LTSFLVFWVKASSKIKTDGIADNRHAGNRFIVLLQRKMSLLAINCRRGLRLARQILGEDRSRQPMIGAAVHDPKRHFATVN